MDFLMGNAALLTGKKRPLVHGTEGRARGDEFDVRPRAQGLLRAFARGYSRKHEQAVSSRWDGCLAFRDSLSQLRVASKVNACSRSRAPSGIPMPVAGVSTPARGGSLSPS